MLRQATINELRSHLNSREMRIKDLEEHTGSVGGSQGGGTQGGGTQGGSVGGIGARIHPSDLAAVSRPTRRPTELHRHDAPPNEDHPPRSAGDPSAARPDLHGRWCHWQGLYTGVRLLSKRGTREMWRPTATIRSSRICPPRSPLSRRCNDVTIPRINVSCYNN